MRLFQIALAFAASFVSFPAYGGQPIDSPPPMPPARADDEAARDAMAWLRFAPMWMPVPKFFPPLLHFPPTFSAEPALPVPSPAYSEIWQPQWQKELGLSAEQKKKLLAIHAKAMAEAKDRAEQFQKLSPEEQKAQMKKWAGKYPPRRGQRDNEVSRQIEAVLTPQQLQTLKDYSFPGLAIGLLYDAKIRQHIGFSAEQEDRLRRVAKERLARFQEVYMERARDLWDMLTPHQQAALPEVVRRQGPTSAVLSIAWDLGFQFDTLVPAYPMLSEAPVRKLLGLSAEQEKQLQVVVAHIAAKREKARQEQLSGKTRPTDAATDWEADAKKQVEAILTPQQLTTLNEVNFRRQVALALGHPEKRKTVGVAAQQAADFQRLDMVSHERLYRIDREMLKQALEILTSRQRQQLREEIDRRVHGK